MLWIRFRMERDVRLLKKLGERTKCDCMCARSESDLNVLDCELFIDVLRTFPQSTKLTSWCADGIYLPFPTLKRSQFLLIIFSPSATKSGRPYGVSARVVVVAPPPPQGWPPQTHTADPPWPGITLPHDGITFRPCDGWGAWPLRWRSVLVPSQNLAICWWTPLLLWNKTHCVWYVVLCKEGPVSTCRLSQQ